MHYSFDVDRAERIAYVRGSGDFDLEKTLRAPLDLFALPDFESDFGVIVDLREIRPGATADDVLGIARNLVRFRALFEHRLALVPPPEINVAVEVATAVAAAAGVAMQVFSTVEAARAWVLSGEG